MPQRKPVSSSSRQSPPASSGPVTSLRHAIFLLTFGWQQRGQMLRDQVSSLQLPDEIQPQAVAWSERLIIRQRLLDTVIKTCVKRHIEQVQPELLCLLRMGSCELLLGPAASQHAAISETVELCRTLGQPKWTGFVNGVLRGVQRLLHDDIQTGPSRKAYPFQELQYRTLNKELFPAPSQKPTEYLQFAFSLPKFLAEKWRNQCSDLEQFWSLGWASLQPSPMYLHVNRLLIEPPDWRQKCEQTGLVIAETEFPEIFRLQSHSRLREIPGFAEGEFWVQDVTASRPARLLNPHPGMRALDLCAGPGTKSAQLAELMLGRGELVACEVMESRIRQIQDNAKRLQLGCLTPRLITREQPELGEEPFDAIIVDAPCSNTGVLGKRPEARWRVSADELADLNQLQLQLLDTAARQLDADGRLVYSTCSIESEENEQLIDRWLIQHPEFVCLSQETTLPNLVRDGGFCALLEMREQEPEGDEHL